MTVTADATLTLQWGQPLERLPWCQWNLWCSRAEIPPSRWHLTSNHQQNSRPLYHQVLCLPCWPGRLWGRKRGYLKSPARLHYGILALFTAHLPSLYVQPASVLRSSRSWENELTIFPFRSNANGVQNKVQVVMRPKIYADAVDSLFWFN